jgi:Zn-dependent protease
VIGTLSEGRIAGVRLRVNWSALVLFIVIGWLLAARLLQAGHPDQPTWAHAVAAACATLVFLAGLLAHEVGHALLARRCGVAVVDITLWLFGGASRTDGEAPDPGAELRISGIGPLINLVIATLFTGLTAAVGLLVSTGLVFGALVWLAEINVVVAVFNIIPAVPLDGGRVLHALLWRWRGDRMWATVMAGRAGQAFGAAVIALGLWEIVVSHALLNGSWLAALGCGLTIAAAAESQQARLHRSLADVRRPDAVTPQTGEPAAAGAHRQPIAAEHS